MTDLFTAVALSMILGSETPRPRDADALANAIGAVVDHESPWEDKSQNQLKALLLVTAYEESHFRMDAIGDSGKAHCALQIHASPSSVATTESCVRVGIQFMRESARMAHALGHPDRPLAQYCGGILVPKAQRIAVARIARALKLARDVETWIAEHDDDETPAEIADPVSIDHDESDEP